MRRRWRLFLLLILLVLLWPGGRVAAQASPEACRGACVMEVTSRRVLFGEGEERTLPNASTTKIMTALLVLEDCDLSEEVVVPREAVGTEGSSIYLREGEVYTVEELLYGLMLRSGNDAAVTLALHHSGSLRRFVQRMNERAAMLGATGTHFCNPHGLPEEGHGTSARDLAAITSHAMENERFRTIVSTQYYAPRRWRNKNKMLTQYEGANGVKTGYTMQAGRCLVTSATREGMTLVCVLLGCPQMYERTAALLDEAFCDYHMAELIDFGLLPEGVGARQFSYPIREEERALVRSDVQLLQPLPTLKGAIAGSIQIYLANDLLFSQNLYMMEAR